MGVVLTERRLCRVWSVGVWSAHAAGNPKALDRSAEHAHAADRFAREIVRILKAFLARSRRLMGKPLGHLTLSAYACNMPSDLERVDCHHVAESACPHFI